MSLSSKNVQRVLRCVCTQARRHAGTALLVLLFPAAALACPACKEALFDPGQLKQTLATAKGYAMSILLLLSMPAVLIGGTAALIVRAHRRQRSNMDS